MTSQKLSKYDQDFADAMATKLKLNREHLNNESSESSVQASEPPDAVEEDSRETLIQEGLEEFPGLTWEEAKQMLDEMGF